MVPYIYLLGPTLLLVTATWDYGQYENRCSAAARSGAGVVGSLSQRVAEGARSVVGEDYDYDYDIVKPCISLYISCEGNKVSIYVSLLNPNMEYEKYDPP